MKFLFIVQGEGRGHLTQAIALAQRMAADGHSVCGALVGSATGRGVPGFFSDAFPAEIRSFASPALVYSRKTKALSLPKTLYALFRHFGRYVKSLSQIHACIREQRPDVIVNFYDVLGGVHQALFRQKVPMVCIAHQYLMLHKDFVHPKGQRLNRALVNLNTRITAWGAEKKLALSFYPGTPDKDIHPVPPLLRQEVKSLVPEAGDYFLAYVTQPAMAVEIAAWQREFPEQVIHCFSSGTDEVREVSQNLFFHPINGPKFLEMMRKCRGVISTAGFESVGEAMVLGKPVLMVPMKNHYEQTCNALDGQRSGAGIYRTSFAISDFADFLADYTDCRPVFCPWEAQSAEHIVGHLTRGYAYRPGPALPLPVFAARQAVRLRRILRPSRFFYQQGQQAGQYHGYAANEEGVDGFAMEKRL